MKHKKIVIALAAAGLCAGALPAHAAGDADRIAQLEKQLKMLQEQVEAMKKSAATSQEVADLRDQVTAQGKEAVVAGDIPNSFRVPGSDTSVRLYGVAELNMVREFKGTNGGDYSTFAPSIPLNGSADAGKKGQTYLHGRTSRIGIEGATPTPYGLAMFKVEGDFNNDPRTGNSAVYGEAGNVNTQQATNSYGFRLRHAYLQVGPWLFGQTWSTFMDIDSTPETVDFNGPIGSTFIRQPQIRYTYTTPTYGNFSAALENSVSYVLSKNNDPQVDKFETSAAGFSKSPDLVLRWDKAYNWGSMSLRAVSHELRLDGTVYDQNPTDGTHASASRRGFGLAASGTIKAVGDDTISWIVTGGNGIGRYFNYIEGAAYNRAANSIELEKAAGLVLGYQHKVSDQLRLNLVYGTQKTFNNGYTELGIGDAVNRRVSQFHIGGFYSPIKVVDIGLEYIYGKRETILGNEGNMSRVNLLARYNLN